MAVKSSFSISFYCRDSKQNRQGLSPLELCININQERLFINLPSKFPPKEFNRKRRPQYIEEVITQFRIKSNEVIAELMRNGLPITAATVRDYMRSGGTKSYAIQDLCEDFLKNLSNNSKESIAKYKLAIQFLVKFFSPETELVTLTQNDMNKLYEGLKAKYMLATASGYLNRIKRIFSYAKDNDLIKSNLFSKIKIKRGISTVKYLTREELKSIESLNLEDYPRLEKVRDLLLFQSSIGLAYIDLMKFDTDKIEVINNTPIYCDKRQKTGIEFSAVILPLGMKILNKYDGKLPLISNQKYNAYLKELQKLADIKTVITTHLLRKSYAHYMLNSGVKIETVARLLGHSNSLITQKIYCRKTTDTIAKEVESLNIL